jgi:hypothetical protein
MVLVVIDSELMLLRRTVAFKRIVFAPGGIVQVYIDAATLVGKFDHMI